MNPLPDVTNPSNHALIYCWNPNHRIKNRLMKTAIHRSILPFLCLWLVPALPLAAQVPVYKGTQITKLTPVAINAKGQIAGNIDTVSGNIHAALYSGGVVTDLGVLSGGTRSEATGINASGQVVGTSNTGSGLDRGFLYSGGVMTDLGALPRGYSSHATAINDAGQITGWSDTLLPNSSYPQPEHAFIYSGGVMTDLGNISGPANWGNFSVGNAINNSGEVVGWSINDNFETHAFRYSGGQMTDLGTLGGTESRANGINDSGTVVGWSYTTGDNGWHAFKFAGSMTDLGTLPGGGNSSAKAINNAGQIVGNSTRAFIHTAQTGLVQLDTRVTGGTWYLSGATAINSVGQILSSGSNETVFATDFLLSVATPSPEIAVTQPAGSNLVDGKTTKSFGTVKIGKSGTAKTFTIKNTGTANLTGLSITKDGPHKSNFIVTSPAKTSLAAGASTTFKVTFKPSAKGTRNAAIHIKSNDSNENPFDIKLAGMGATP